MPSSASKITGLLFFAALVLAPLTAAAAPTVMVNGGTDARRRAISTELATLETDGTFAVDVDDAGVARVFTVAGDGTRTLRDTIEGPDDAIVARRVAETVRAVSAAPAPPPPAPAREAAKPAIVVQPQAATSSESSEDHDKPGLDKNRVRHHVLQEHPLSAALLRISFTYELLPVAHHAVSIGVHAPLFTMNNSTIEERYYGVGGELGYRYYSGEKGPNGFFVGPSFIAGRYYSADGIDLGAFSGRSDTWFTSLGVAADVGYAFFIGSRVHMAFGAGVQYNHADVDRNELGSIANLFSGTGVRPRALFSIGFALD